MPMSDRTQAAGKRKSIATLAGAHAEAAIAALAAIMTNSETAPATRIAAANTLLQWGCGKASGTTRERSDPEKLEEGARQLVRLYWAPE
jgi:hypothetical protein